VSRALFTLLVFAGVAAAGYEAPSFIDGCRTADGRFVVTAEPVGKTATHGPNQWRFVWKDTKADKTITSDAKEVSAGQVYGHLFVAPDGETFALFQHVTLWAKEKSNGHGAAKLTDEPGKARDFSDDAFSRRIVVYKKDGTVVKTLGVADLLTADEQKHVLLVFNRAHWLREFDGLQFKKTPRPGYAFYKVSPDYSVLEVQAPLTDKKAKAGRVIRIDLTSGAVLAADAKLSEDKTPVRPFRGPDTLPDADKGTREGYVPSLDPVREEGKLPTKKETP
jgi:hypothetical protein